MNYQTFLFWCFLLVVTILLMGAAASGLMYMAKKQKESRQAVKPLPINHASQTGSFKCLQKTGA